MVKTFSAAVLRYVEGESAMRSNHVVFDCPMNVCVFLQHSGSDWDDTVGDVLCGLFSAGSRRRLPSRRRGSL